MRPSDLTFRGEETLPVWAATLVRQLASGGSGAPPDVLSPVPLVEEVISIIDGLTQGHEPAQRADLCSLRDDLMLALEQLGSATKDLLRPRCGISAPSRPRLTRHSETFGLPWRLRRLHTSSSRSFHRAKHVPPPSPTVLTLSEILLRLTTANSVSVSCGRSPRRRATFRVTVRS